MNQQNSFQISLEGLGLSENESRVYLSMLSLGPASILNISKAADVNRTTIYNVIENLNRKGLTRVDAQGFKKLYVAEHPRRLETMLERRKDDFKELFPELEALFNLKGGQSFVRYYEGSESVRNLYFDLLDELEHNEEFLVIGDPEKWEQVNKSFGAEFIKQRNKRKLRIRMMLTDSETGRKYKQFERNFQEEIKFLPADSRIDTNLVITLRKILIQQMVNPIVAVTIETGSIVTMHQELFNVMWRTL
ncbi:MAG: Transcriptional regulator, TrmB [Parcubacteria group bacterium]|nr:Transcriptional regulator, TrmB [Parcubacteria group bacterium]